MLPILAPPSLQIPVSPSPSVADAVAAAERAFSADAGRLGTPAAFLAHLAPDSTVFTPKPENGPTMQRAQRDDGSRLAWHPSYVEVAASGDFAVSTGAWSWRVKPGAAPSLFGHFLSLWVLREGRWQVLADIGVSQPPQAEGPLKRVSHEAPPFPGDPVEAAWRAFDGAADRDLAGALRGAAAADLRLYRNGQAVTPGNLADLAAAEAGPATWEPQGRAEAASRDLAVRWGARTRNGARVTVLQVWRRVGPAWRLAMDVAQPFPPGP